MTGELPVGVVVYESWKVVIIPRITCWGNRGRQISRNGNRTRVEFPIGVVYLYTCL